VRGIAELTAAETGETPDEMIAEAPQPIDALLARDVLERVVCGVDLTPAGLEAARQAASLVNDDGSLLLVGAVVGDPVAVSAAAGLGGTVVHVPPDEATRARHRAALRDAARAARATFPPTRDELVENQTPLGALLQAIADERATLAVVGSHDWHRLPGIALGSVATHLLHKAPCSILIARPHGARLSRVLVGIDGSGASVLALAVAAELALRLDCGLEKLVAHGGAGVHDLDVVARLAPDVDSTDDPVHALVSKAAPGDVIVVGSRALHGVRALGSVSERVAHRAPCSVLVVRPRLGT
jgi:nucleotide-binding universal stress UspA family protein